MKRFVRRVTVTVVLCLALALPLFADSLPQPAVLDGSNRTPADKGVSDSGMEQEIRDARKQIEINRERSKEDTAYLDYERRRSELERAKADAEAEIDRLIRELSKAESHSGGNE